MFEKEEEINGLYDYVFKKIFTKEEYFLFLVKLITKKDYSNMNLIISNTEKKNDIDKKGIDADIIGRLDDDINNVKIVIDLEPQKYDILLNVLLNRETHYASYFFSDMFDVGSNYSEDRKYISIFILDKYGIKGLPIAKTYLYNEETGEQKDIICFYHVYLKQIVSKDFKIEDENAKMLLEVVKLLYASDLKPFLKSNKTVLKEMAKVINNIKMDENEKIRAFQEQRAENIRKNASFWEKQYAKEEGRTQGLEEGKQEQLILNVKNLHESGLSIDLIAQGLKIDIEYVKDILSGKIQ